MALNVYSRLTRSTIVRVLASRSVIPVTRQLTTTSCWTHLRCLQLKRVIRYDGSSLRNFSSSSQPSIDVSYEQLKKLLLSDSSVVIDVREPWELREYGNIPGSINVPLGQVNGALHLTPDDFKEKYGGVMPSQSQNIVFTCLAGVRSKKALETAVSLGYTKVQHYPGGWQEWAEHQLIQTKE
ncbi:thiosulfate sulfurtransferase/rhodanese-like domain-containing protein 3 isoform X2 [Sinocyclocheilus rhinocerous]|uniref:thiosulfate sulfurtransferase/rhodanese-like domain-containing protein 3 isoform X2 n=1 Tax=Sinocyclocheilus rhinocerous TaxID=307959 RepID=UPI0007BAC954|nr:PREDICTED: thiosulfate sulfurtransferase/rhodanese-like domain-containing protein 3 isoform X2 [Sinocyclocheilus rhinocerous]